MDIKEYCGKKIKESQDVLECSNRIIGNAPEGSLVVRTVRGKNRYFSSINGHERYIGQDDVELIRALQEKFYCEELKKVYEKSIQSYERILCIVDSLLDFNEVFARIPEYKRNLIKPYIPAENEKIKARIEKECRQWAHEKQYIKLVEEDSNFVTLNGERVRSKSELIIADRLKNAKVPYYYEGKYMFVNEMHDMQVWYPDFQAINTRTGDKILWEHFGMMDNEEYLSKCLFKLETYAKHGIVLGKNLILTMESRQHPLNVAYVDKLIAEFLK